MDLQCSLPESVSQSLFRQIGSDSRILYALKSDLTPERRFGEGYLIVTENHLACADARRVLDVLPLAHIKEIRIDELFSSSRLVAVLDGKLADPAEKVEGQSDADGGEKRLAYYTKTMVPEFGVLCRVINDLVQNRTPELPDSEGQVWCPKCGLPLPERGANCPACVPRFAVFRRLLVLVRPYRARAGILVLMTFLGVAAQMGPPYFTKRIVDDVMEAKDISALWFWIAAMFGCHSLFLGAQWLGGYLSAWLAARVTTDLRSKLHAHLQRLEMSYFGKREAGELVSRVMRDTGQLQHFLIDGLPYLFVNVLSFVIIAAILLHLDAWLALLVFLPVPFLVGGVKWFWKKLIPLFHQEGSRHAGLYSILGESIRGIKAIKAASDEPGRSGRFDKRNKSLFHTTVRIESHWLGFQRGSFWIMSLGVTLVWLFGAQRIATSGPEARFTVGSLFAFTGYIWLFYGPLQWFSVIVNWMSHAFAGAERIFAVLDTPMEVYEAPDAVHLPEIRGAICFEDVRFSYERGKEVIKGIDLTVSPGEMIGLVGKSGAGKSTIINLICRFYDTDSGRITIDGHDIKKIRLEDLRGQIGLVMQEPFLFRQSILENIRYGSPDLSFGEVVEAAKIANAHGFIVDKEHGYDTIIGEGGMQLSGGEKQRIAIARAILHDPPILILDEATNAVDSETEQAIQEAIAHLVKNRTTVAIAHRLATLRNADRLVVIEDGKIAEIGTHDELIQAEGIYAGLVKTQTRINELRSDLWAE